MAQQRRGGFKRRKKVDYIAANKIEYVDYKDTELLSRFVSERGKILPRRVTGTSAKNQRKVTTAIKRARVMALMPFVNEDSKRGPGGPLFQTRLGLFFTSLEMRERVGVRVDLFFRPGWVFFHEIVFF